MQNRLNVCYILFMELIVQKRKIFGKKVKELRNQDLIPAELYGREFKNLHLSVSTKNFLRVFKETGESSIIELVFNDNEESKKNINVLVHDVQRHPLIDKIFHIDFYRVKMDEVVKITVPLEFINEAPAVKEKKGVLIKAINEIEIEALPSDLLHNISVDLSVLDNIGKNIYVEEIKISEKIKVLTDLKTVIVAVAEPIKEEEVKEIRVEDVKVAGKEQDDNDDKQ